MCTLHQALAVACDKLDPNYLPKLGATKPVCDIGPFAVWSDPSKIGSMDPWGHLVTDVSQVKSYTAHYRRHFCTN